MSVSQVARPDFIQPGFGNTWLSNMVEITLPTAPGWLPQTWGWIVLAAVAVALSARYLWQLRQNWLARAYLRQAKRELHIISGTLTHSQQYTHLRQLPELLKRVALRENPRELVAGLSGQAWLQFLEAPFGDARFSEGPGTLLLTLSYGDQQGVEQLASTELQQLLTLCGDWLELPSRSRSDD
jgi:hypothetical protein